jgi:hypothetical protein
MSLAERIQDMRNRPHHEKKRAVYGLAALGAGLVAVAWLGGSLATDSFAITLPSQESAGIESAPQGASQAQYAGAAAAFAPGAKEENSGIEILTTATSSSLSGKKADQTVIPF